MSRYIRHWRSAFSFLLAFQFVFFAPADASAMTPAKIAPAEVFHYRIAPAKVMYSVKALDVRTVARFHIAANYGWGTGQFSCLDRLWTQESHWNYRARNESSGAGGIPQALPANKMASAGADWRVNPVTQIRWGTRYIAVRYGTPCAALNFKFRKGYY